MGKERCGALLGDTGKASSGAQAVCRVLVAAWLAVRVPWWTHPQIQGGEPAMTPTEDKPGLPSSFKRSGCERASWPSFA